MSVDNMRSIVLLLCTCIANFRFYKPSFPYCARLCWIKKWQQQQPESHNNFGIEEFSAASLKSYSTRPKSLPLLGVSVSVSCHPSPPSIQLQHSQSSSAIRRQPSVFMQN